MEPYTLLFIPSQAAMNYYRLYDRTYFECGYFLNVKTTQNAHNIMSN